MTVASGMHRRQPTSGPNAPSNKRASVVVSSTWRMDISRAVASGIQLKVDPFWTVKVWISSYFSDKNSVLEVILVDPLLHLLTGVRAVDLHVTLVLPLELPTDGVRQVEYLRISCEKRQRVVKMHQIHLGELNCSEHLYQDELVKTKKGSLDIKYCTEQQAHRNLCLLLFFCCGGGRQSNHLPKNKMPLLQVCGKKIWWIVTLVLIMFERGCAWVIFLKRSVSLTNFFFFQFRLLAWKVFKVCSKN